MALRQWPVTVRKTSEIYAWDMEAGNDVYKLQYFKLKNRDLLSGLQ